MLSKQVKCWQMQMMSYKMRHLKGIQKRNCHGENGNKEVQKHKSPNTVNTQGSDGIKCLRERILKWVVNLVSVTEQVTHDAWV